MKILIVDDNAVILSVVEAILSQENHEVYVGGNGILGYNQFLNIRPDLVLTDIEMPWQDGISMVQAIRRHEPSVRTIYMTGNPGPYLPSLKMEQRCHPVGILYKPFTRSALLRAVSDVVRLETPPASSHRPANKTAVEQQRFRESLSRAKFEVEELYHRADRPHADSRHFAERFVGEGRRVGAGR
jgi:DNA-binding response OmpR family regulator